MAKYPEFFADYDVTKYFADFKFPGFDVEALVTAQRRNFEAFAAANKLGLEGLQAVAKRQGEILRQMVEETASVSRQVFELGSPQDKAAKQTELLKDNYERSVANMREIGEMVARSQTAAVEVLNKRFAQGLDEMRELVSKSK